MTKAPTISRRAALTGLAASVVSGAGRSETAAQTDAGPVFSPTGPDAERYGATEGFPIAVPLRVNQPGDPPDKYKIGAYSHYDEIHPTRPVARAATPWAFKRAPLDFRYSFKGSPASLTDYLSRNPVTGLLVAKDDTILFEHYQYGRTDRDRFNAGSMTKSITGLLIGLAIADGAIKSVDDTAETYVPGFKGSEYVLGVVLHHAVGKSLSDYFREKVWEPIGAEADAKWLIDAEGFELAHAFFNAVLRDYARLGRLLAHDGAWNGRQIIPREWLIEATTVRASDAYLAPGHATPRFGYGYLLWLFGGARRQFALQGFPGQRILVDPVSKLVLVQTGVGPTEELWPLWSALSAQSG